MSAPKTVELNKPKSIEITQAYAEYKIRHAGDLDEDLADWEYNLMRSKFNSKKMQKSDKT